MAAWSLGRSARRWAGAILALLAFGSLTPATGRAEGCHLRDHKGALDAHFDRLVLAGALAATPGREASDPADPPTPCSGAFCSGKPAVPSVPVPAAAAARVTQWACPAERPRSVGVGPLLARSSEDQARPVRRPNSIFHPPRPA